MRRLLLTLAALLSLSSPLAAQVCNDPGGFLKSHGEINVGDLLALGPGCQDVSSSGSGSSGQFILTGVISATISANTDNFNPAGLANASTIRLTATAQWNITGIAGGSNGRILLLKNVGTFPIVLKNDQTSTLANRFDIAQDIVIGAEQGVMLNYDLAAARWNAVQRQVVRWVTPEMFGAKSDASTDDQAAWQAAINSGFNVRCIGRYAIGSTITITSAFSGYTISGSGGFNDCLLATNLDIPIFTITSAGGVIENSTFSGLQFYGNVQPAFTDQTLFLFTGANYIQHNLFENIECQQARACFENDTNTVSWTTFSNIRTRNSYYGHLWHVGSSTGNVWNGGTMLVTTAGIQIGDGADLVGDLIFSNLHIGADAGSGIGINLIGSAAYGTLVALNGNQFDAGLTYSLQFNTINRVTGGGNNWGGGTSFNFTNVSSIEFMFALVVSPSQITADQNDYNPTDLRFAKQLRLTSNAARSITGIVAQYDGREMEIFNEGTFPLTFVDASGSSSANNRFDFGGALVLPPKRAVTLRYRGGSTNRWQLNSSIAQMLSNTVTNLPACGANALSLRYFVTDATATTFASVVAGGGANGVPVYCDGTNWRIG